MLKAPCFGCENRQENCHNICREYKEWRVSQYAQKNKIKLEDAYRGYASQACKNMKERRKKKYD